MKRTIAATLLSTLTLVAGGAYAGADSTDRWHGVGPAWYEVEGGLQRFAASTRDEPLPWGDDPSKPQARNEAPKNEAAKDDAAKGSSRRTEGAKP